MEWSWGIQNYIPGFSRRVESLEESAGFLIIITTRFTSLEARCVCRQAAEEAAKILTLVGLARSKQNPINRGHGAQYLS
jgi:hypothetical protein